MATTLTRLMPILVVITCVSAESPPLPPSHLVCFRPCSDRGCTVNIHCTWDQRPDNNVPTNYILYWKSANSKEEHVSRGVKSDGLIPRENATRREELRVWVQATNQYGSANAEHLVFHAEDIIKPPPPKFSSISDEPLEVHWNTVCDELGLYIGPCEVRYRTEEDETWLKLEDELHGSYTLLDPIPGTFYEFQVRCSCDTGLMSDWSAGQKIKSAELAPVGKVDVWRDCGMFNTSFDCYLAWKSLPASQARGVILGYEVRISYKNHTSALINVSTVGPNKHFVYNGKTWHLSSPLKDVSSVSVSAFNALGATFPSCLALPLKASPTDEQRSDENIYLSMNEVNLTVSWNLPAHLSDNQNQYLVQYKEAGYPGGHGFDWIKVRKNKTAEFSGQFKKYTPYQVSLFQIPHNREVRYLASKIGFSDEKAPPSVPSFRAFSVGENEVSLVWKNIPLSDQNGMGLYYQIGIGVKEVHNVSASLHHENKPFKIQGLHPGQGHKVWIRAVNAAGAGPKVTIGVTTKHHKNYELFIGVPLAVILMGICCIFSVFCACQRRKSLSAVLPQFLTEKIPDPSNSSILKQMPLQMNESFHWILLPNSDQDPKISMLEILERKSQNFQVDGLTGPGEVDGCPQTDCSNNEMNISVQEEHDRPGCGSGREAYSQMPDSDEDSHSSDDEQFTSGYEQHFMPTAMDILDI